MLRLTKLQCGYHGRAIIEDISFDVPAGDIVCVLGANGAGKTTLYRSLMNMLPPISGQVTIDGIDIRDIRRNQMAKKIAYVPQSQTITFPFTVLDVITMGRTSHLSLFQCPSDEEEDIALKAMSELGISAMAHRRFTEISGGERQLVLIARALAQNADILLMDEPTSNLDFGNQVQILDCIRKLAGKNRAVIYSTHSPDQAFACSTKVAVLLGERKFAVGPAGEILTEPVLKRIYGVDVHIRSVRAGNGASTVCLPVRT